MLTQPIYDFLIAYRIPSTGLKCFLPLSVIGPWVAYKLNTKAYLVLTVIDPWEVYLKPHGEEFCQFFWPNANHRQSSLACCPIWRTSIRSSWVGAHTHNTFYQHYCIHMGRALSRHKCNKWPIKPVAFFPVKIVCAYMTKKTITFCLF